MYMYEVSYVAAASPHMKIPNISLVLAEPLNFRKELLVFFGGVLPSLHNEALELSLSFDFG